jgi:hypothetical protein
LIRTASRTIGTLWTYLHGSVVNLGSVIMPEGDPFVFHVKLDRRAILHVAGKPHILRIRNWSHVGIWRETEERGVGRIAWDQGQQRIADCDEQLCVGMVLVRMIWIVWPEKRAAESHEATS